MLLKRTYLTAEKFQLYLLYLARIVCFFPDNCVLENDHKVQSNNINKMEKKQCSYGSQGLTV